MSVLVVGASGAVGGAVVEGLVGRGVEVRAASRSPERFAAPVAGFRRGGRPAGAGFLPLPL